MSRRLLLIAKILANTTATPAPAVDLKTICADGFATCMREKEHLESLFSVPREHIEGECALAAQGETDWVREGKFTIAVDGNGCTFLGLHGDSSSACISEIPPDVTTIKITTTPDAKHELVGDILLRLQNLGLKRALIKPIQVLDNGA